MARGYATSKRLGDQYGHYFVGKCPKCRAQQWIMSYARWHCEGKNNMIKYEGCNYAGESDTYKICTVGRAL